MHPPRFSLTHHPSDWPACGLEVHCCKGMVVYPAWLLAAGMATGPSAPSSAGSTAHSATGSQFRSIFVRGIAPIAGVLRRIGRLS